MKMLRTLRKSNGLSQATLSKQLGVSRSTVAMWETGQSAPDIYTLKLLAEMFSVTVDMLIGNESNAYAKSVKIPVLGKVAAGIPIFLVCGDADRVVPYAENGKALYDYVSANGGNITAIVKPDCDHHPHGLDDLSPLVEFTERYGK